MVVSSKPHTEISPGTANPASDAAQIVPVAMSSSPAKTAVGRCRSASSLRAAATPDSNENLPGTMYAGFSFKPARFMPSR